MVTGRDHAWQEGAYVWDKSRVLEHTAKAHKDAFGSFSPSALASLGAFPTLFMYERGSQGVVRVGKVKHVQPRAGEIRVIYEFDDTVPPLSLAQIERLKWELQIEDFEFGRTHWAVKNVDLYSVLQSAGLYRRIGLGIPPPHASTGPAKVEIASVFLVHGRDNGKRHEVARFLETKAGLKVRVLSELPNKGRTIITKFQEESAGATFAVVLMTPDDFGYLRPKLNDGKKSEPRPRARQNVVFELGFFVAKFGANRVCVLLGAGVEQPSDYDGVVYIPFDEHEGWTMKLINELQAANIPIAENWWNESRNSSGDATP